MTESYRTFHIHGGAEAAPEMLLGRTRQWCVTGWIAYVRPNQSVVELTRFRMSCMTFDDEKVASWFGLELARLIVDSCYRELAMECYTLKLQVES